MSTGADSAVVVGGGIIGIACAHYLAEDGMDVTVIDQSTIGGACSHGNCGYVCPSHILPLYSPGALQKGMKSLFSSDAAFRIKPQLRLGLYRWLAEFTSRCTQSKMIKLGHGLQPILESSIDEYGELFGANDLAAEWREDGLMYVFASEESLDDFATTDTLLQENYGVAATRLEGHELPEDVQLHLLGLGGAEAELGDEVGVVGVGVEVAAFR